MSGVKGKGGKKGYGRHPEDIKGKTFGKLTVLSLAHRDSNGVYFWNCLCSCGKRKIARGHSLKRGHVQSCGCMRYSPYNTGPARRVYATAEEAAWTFNYNQYKRNAKLRKISCLISFEEFKTICSKPCFYCQSPPEERPSQRGRSSIFASGIDRKNNSDGYTIENSVPCCTWCNRAKNSYSVEEFVHHCIKVANARNE
jgi:hypothetical protein